MSLLGLILLTSISFITSHHVIFENIGQLASAVTYLHAKVTINFSHVEDQYLIYRSAIGSLDERLEKRYAKPYPSRRPEHLNKSQDHKSLLNERWSENIKQCREVVQYRKKSSGAILTAINTARDSMPKKPEVHSRFIQRSTENITRGSSTWDSPLIPSRLYTSADDSITRFRLPRVPAIGSLLGGAFGTFLGLYNTHRINQLTHELQDVKQSHNQLVEVVVTHSNEISKLNGSLDELTDYVGRVHELNPTSIDQSLQIIETGLYRAVDHATRAVQMAQLRRMSVDLINSAKLHTLFHRLKSEAEQINNILLINQPSDLFQLEVSYFSDGQDVHILIHVPSVPKTGLLDLYQLHPFPLPVEGNFSLIPIVTNNVLALTTDHNKYHAQLSTTQLMDCIRINQVYICERHGVLSKDLSSSCLGALYLQNSEKAQELCQIQVAPIREIVFQLLSNWFLIYSPVVFTSDVHCQNGTMSRFFIPLGISKHFLSPGCQADFKENVLFSNTAIRIDSDLIHFEWEWEKELFKLNTPIEIIENLQTIQQSGISTPTLNDINHLKVNTKSGFNYLYQIVGFVLSTIATTIVTMIVIFLMAKYRVRIFDFYHQYAQCCFKQTLEITPANADTIPLNQRNRNLPIYTDGYQRNYADDPL